MTHRILACGGAFCILGAAATSAAWHLRQANPLRLDQLRQTVRAAVARRGEETLAWLAIGGTLAAMFLTAYQVRQGWEQRQ